MSRWVRWFVAVSVAGSSLAASPASAATRGAAGGVKSAGVQPQATTVTRFGDAGFPAPSYLTGVTGIASAGTGYVMVDASGELASADTSSFLYNQSISSLAAPIVGVTADAQGNAAWLVGSDGGVVTVGAADYFGSTAGVRLSGPVVGIAATPGGRGYWLVAADGGVFGFGDAGFHGSTGGVRLSAPVVGMAATPDGRGYWLVAADGGVFGFGDAGFYGSTGGVRLSAPVVGMAATPDGRGYWLVAADGGVFSFGDARFHGSLAGSRPVGGSPAATTIGIARTQDGNGYWLLSSAAGLTPDAEALARYGYTPIQFASTGLPGGQPFNIVSTYNNPFAATFLFVGSQLVAASIPEPGVPTVAPGTETAYQAVIGAGTAPGQLVAAYPSATFTYSWNGSAVVTGSHTYG